MLKKVYIYIYIYINKYIYCKTSEKFIKYINRVQNATMNMISIVSSYINNNIKPKIFVLGTKICNNDANGVM